MLEPSYGEGVDQQLDEVESDDSRRSLWNAICNTLDVICDKPDSSEARRHRIDFQSGIRAWRVPVHAYEENENWSIIWSRGMEDEAVILYVGAWPPVD